MSDSGNGYIEQIEDKELNIYILSGVFGGTTLLLLILVIVLFVMINKANARIEEMRNDISSWIKGPPGLEAPVLPRAIPYGKPNSIYGGPTPPLPQRYP